MAKTPKIEDAVRWASSPTSGPRELYMAADLFVSWGRLDEADEVMARLEGVPAVAGGLRRLKAASRQIRRSGVIDDLSAMSGEMIDGRHEAFTARYDGETNKAIIVFTGVDPRFWLSLMLLHLFLKRLNTHVIYLSDMRFLMFLDGLETIAKGYDGLLQALRGTLDELGVEDVHVLANSSGGYAGLLYAMDLQAKSFLGMSIRTDLSPNSTLPVGGFFQRPELREMVPDKLMDLKPLLANSRWPERTMLFSGDGNPVDVPHALHIADLPNVQLKMLRNHVQHDVIAGLIANGDFESVLREFVYGDVSG